MVEYRTGHGWTTQGGPSASAPRLQPIVTAPPDPVYDTDERYLRVRVRAPATMVGTVTSKFRSSRRPGHTAVDIAVKGPLLAMTDGVITAIDLSERGGISIRYNMFPTTEEQRRELFPTLTKLSGEAGFAPPEKGFNVAFTYRHMGFNPSRPDPDAPKLPPGASLAPKLDVRCELSSTKRQLSVYYTKSDMVQWSSSTGAVRWPLSETISGTAGAVVYRRQLAVGDVVKQGELIGWAGNTGYVIGNNGIHLHLEMRVENNNGWSVVDPLKHIKW